MDYGIANFASDHLMPTVQKVVDEASGMFSDELFFFGGDETACPYNECAQCIRRSGLADACRGQCGAAAGVLVWYYR